jgi:hypothetical protein
MLDEWKAAVATLITIIVGSTVWSYIAKFFLNRELARYDRLTDRVDQLEKAHSSYDLIRVQLESIESRMDHQDRERAIIHGKLDAGTKEIHAIDVKLAAMFGSRRHDDDWPR